MAAAAAVAAVADEAEDEDEDEEEEEEEDDDEEDEEDDEESSEFGDDLDHEEVDADEPDDWISSYCRQPQNRYFARVGENGGGLGRSVPEPHAEGGEAEDSGCGNGRQAAGGDRSRPSLCRTASTWSDCRARWTTTTMR